MLIWADGRIVPEDTSLVRTDDRAFEHGLGLFETLRTRDGVATMLGRHTSRLIRSAAELGLEWHPTALPDAVAVADLLRANRVAVDVLLRITLSGGRPGGGPSHVWMRHAPLPPALKESGAVLALAPWTVAADDPLARHKTLNYWSKRLAYERGRAGGADEVLLATADGRVWEGSRTNLFLVRGATLITPGLDGPVLPGLMRALVLENAAAIGLEARERDVSIADLDVAEEVFLTNAVRGLVPVGRIAMTPRTLAVPGPWTDRLGTRIERWLHEGGGPS